MANPALRTTLLEAEARLVSISQERLTPGDVLVRQWTELDASVAESLFDARKASSLYVTDPQADGQTYEGTWVRSDLQIVSGQIFEIGGFG